MTTCRSMLADATRRLRAAGVDSPQRDAAILMGHVLGVDRLALIREPERVLAPGQRRRYDALVRRRARREPLSHLVCGREFWGHRFEVSADVLDPRADSETLIEAILREVADRQAPLRILDLGTGSGCLVLSLLFELPNACGTGLDRSLPALRVARRNARKLGLAERAAFACGDWAGAVDSRYDIVVANPPYVVRDQLSRLQPEVRDYEPLIALDGDADGLQAYRRLVPDLPRLLLPDGLAVLEHGLGQGPEVAALLQQSDLNVIAVRCDLAGVERCVLARCDAAGQNRLQAKKVLESSAVKASLQ